ncbi:uncharacterized protein LOC126965244 [Leptidea sinapis]|uniref:uncharacterized protein LOC126965244 n=1 Tax=Leptidea sinapis TaxID=189913 RepID=UPI002126B551|nr:uncharacterized protein LOC126965244 [Leptidea sinapis]
MNASLERRKEIHQKIIDSRHALVPGRDENEYCDPIFVKNVEQEVMEELNIKYFYSEFDHMVDLIRVAKYFQCPILTKNFEYCLYGVSCITPHSLNFGDTLKCTLYDLSEKHVFPRSRQLLSVLLAASDEDSPLFCLFPRDASYTDKNVFFKRLHWIRRQNFNEAISDLSRNLNESNKKSFIVSINEFESYFRIGGDRLALSYFKEINLNKYDFFARLVASGAVAVPYINLRYNKTFSGSWLIFDENKDDAMWPVLEMIFHVLGLLTKSVDVKISFIGRKHLSSCVLDKEMKLRKNRALRKSPPTSDMFQEIMCEILNDFKFQLLNALPEDCRMIALALVYYCYKSGEDFKNGIYSVILSYFMLGRVLSNVGVMRKSNFVISHAENATNENGNYATVARSFLEFFYISGSRAKEIFSRSMLHRMSEFEHCLQHMNYLNRLVDGKMKCTIYHKSINTAFINNIMASLINETSPLDFIKNKFQCDSMFLQYKNIIDVIENCVKLVQSNN